MTPPKISRAQFLSFVGLGVISLVLARIETLGTTIKAIVPDDSSNNSAYGQSAYGA